MGLIIINLIEAALIAWFLSSFAEITQKKNLYRIIIFIFNFVVITYSNYIDMYDVFLTSFLIVGNFIITTFFTKEDSCKIAFVVCFETLFAAFVNASGLLVNSVIAKINANHFSKILYLLVGYYVLKYLRGKQLYFNNNMYWGLAAVLYALHFVIQHFIQIYLLFEYVDKNLILSFLMFMAAFIGFFFLMVKMSEWYKSNLSYKILKIEKDNERVLTSLYEEVSILKHDTVTIYKLLERYIDNNEYEKLFELIKTKVKDIEDIPMLIRSANDCINVVINWKIGQAYKKNIHVKCDVRVKAKIPIKDYELHVLLSNILDNAIENCSPKGMITIQIVQVEHFLHIRVDNTIEEYSDLKTKKAGNNHGYGLKSIRRIAQKYDGESIINQQDHLFSMEVSLYLASK